MTTANSKAPDGFYFALPRLCRRLGGRANEVSENNAVEAYGGSIGAFIVTFLLAWQIFAHGFNGWRLTVLVLLLVPAVWIFWLLVFFINSLVIKILRRTGLFRNIPNRDAQNIFVGAVIALLAYQLSILPLWVRWIGILYLFMLAINVCAAVLLKFSTSRN